MQDTNPDAENNLKETEAKSRASQVSNVAYELKLKLQKGAETYHADIVISFEFKKESGNLFLDFVGRKITQFKINEQDISDNWKGNRLHIGEKLKEGKNVLHIVYENAYDHTGNGFHQFVDPEDKQEYLYTNFEPFECHRWIPCFDQPNIKGHFSLHVEAPSDWKVITNSSVEKSHEISKDITSHKFITTPKISTYLFALVAGPYDVFNDNFDNRVPLGIYIRKSLTKYLDADNFFVQTKQGLKFYEDFFEFKYPFTKYDQIFVPEFNVGAMENVGCVTFTEHYVFKDPPTRSQVANRADTILHEMAHMWFGNLVSPVWWDGLWLNESFATYMAALCTAEATEFKGLGWQNFNTSMKEWGYREDELSTTHPIQGEVVDTDATFLNFDGITYGKGASLLKQLVYVLGMDKFKQGMRYYFKKYAWGNTTISQFLEALETSAEGVLHASSWSKEWLETAGLNSLELNISSDKGKISKVYIEQSAPAAYPTLGNHHLEIVVFDYDGKNLVLRESFKAIVKAVQQTEISHLIGQNLPAFIYINHNDNTYAKCILDPQSKEFIIEHMEKLSDPLLRQLLWNSFYTLTRDAIVKSTDFIKLVSTKVTFETDAKLVQSALARAGSAVEALTPNALVQSQADLLFFLCFKQISNTTEDFKIIWARASVRFASSAEAVKILLEQVKLNNPAFSQTERWLIIHKAITWEIEGAQEVLSKEQERDKSDKGEQAVLTARTCPPKKAVKDEAWARFLNKDSKLSVHQSAADMAGFRWRHQKGLLEDYTDKFFSSVRSIFAERDKEFARNFWYFLYPEDPENPVILEKTRKLLGELTPQEQHLAHTIKGQIDDVERAVKCIKLHESE